MNCEQKEHESNAEAEHVAVPVQAAQSSYATRVTRSLILAVSVCYHSRLCYRSDYEQRISHEFTAPLALPGGAVEFQNIIRW